MEGKDWSIDDVYEKISEMHKLVDSSLNANESNFEYILTEYIITLGDRAFQQAAPKLWNNLPTFIRNLKSLNSFKAATKTHYFKLVFN